MSSVFGTGQSMNSMARIMKASQMSKVCASSHEYPHVEKIFVNKISKVRWPSRLSRQNNLKAKRKTTGKKETQRKTSQQTEKPHGKKKNLTAEKRKKNKKCPEVVLFSVRFFFLPEVFLFAVRLILLL